MKLVKGWRKISNEGGYVNENTGQTLIVSKKEYSKDFQVVLFVGKQTDKNEGKPISPDYSSQPRAEAFAVDWMQKHPNGTV
jgi:hypothetical protein